MTIQTECRVNEVVCYIPETVAVFKQLGIDTCCGGSLTLTDAARKAGISPDILLAKIQRAAVAASSTP